MAINKNDKIFEQFNREALFKKLQDEMQKRDTPPPGYSPPKTPMLRFPQTIKPLQPELRLNPPEPVKPIPMPLPLGPIKPVKPMPRPYYPEKPEFVMPHFPGNLDDLRGMLKIPDTTHDDGFYISPEPQTPTKPKLAPELPDGSEAAIPDFSPWDKLPFNSADILKKKPEIPQAEVDETQKIVVDWFGDTKLPDGFAKRLAEIMSKSEHSPFETAPIKVDTGSEIVRDWFEDEPEKLVQYYKA